MRKHIIMAALHLLLVTIGAVLIGLGFGELLNEDLVGALLDLAIGGWIAITNARWCSQEMRAAITARKDGRR